PGGCAAAARPGTPGCSGLNRAASETGWDETFPHTLLDRAGAAVRHSLQRVRGIDGRAVAAGRSGQDIGPARVQPADRAPGPDGGPGDGRAARTAAPAARPPCPDARRRRW